MADDTKDLVMDTAALIAKLSAAKKKSTDGSVSLAEVGADLNDLIMRCKDWLVDNQDSEDAKDGTIQ